jgi:8-oxo-dGTP pyrophosphatase MutT (NUDIX family)
MTALREAHEELGIAPEVVEVVGVLDDVATYQSAYIVTPVVGLMRGAPETRPNPDEIARVMEVSIAEILAFDAALPARPNWRELRYPLDGEDVWGATARILRDFAEIARAAVADEPT